MSEKFQETVRPRILLVQDLRITPTDKIYHINANYAEAIYHAGGMPFFAPFIDTLIPELLDQADGILFSGSAPGNNASAIRIEFEQQLLACSLERAIPVLGICHGMQLIGKYLGARIEDIETPHSQSLHLPYPCPDRHAHEVHLAAGSWIRNQYGRKQSAVNSFHRQSITDDGDFLIAATAPDGTIEAIEGNCKSLCIGVQWHPEFLLSELDRTLMRSFINAAAHNKPTSENQND